jgi:hypothetical protein
MWCHLQDLLPLLLCGCRKQAAAVVVLCVLLRVYPHSITLYISRWLCLKLTGAAAAVVVLVLQAFSSLPECHQPQGLGLQAFLLFQYPFKGLQHATRCM